MPAPHLLDLLNSKHLSITFYVIMEKPLQQSLILSIVAILVTVSTK